MVFVFTAVILFYTFLFWHIERLNRVAKREACKTRSQENE